MSRTGVILRGGLGNQLFQWALALELQHRGRPVVLDTRRTRSERGLAIQLVDNTIPRSTWPSLGWRVRGLLPFDMTAMGYRLVEEPSFRFWPGALEEALPQRVLLHGYWQSQCYFSSVHQTVRQRVSEAARQALTERGLGLLREIQSTEHPVSVHLRRGDFVTNPVAAGYHGILTDDYYTTALDRMRAGGAQRFYIFSDDIAEANRLFRSADCVVVPHAVADDPLGELELMAACRAHILANSSFSWWGAWLDTRSGPVIAPRRWFTDARIDTSDLILEQWTQL